MKRIHVVTIALMAIVLALLLTVIVNAQTVPPAQPRTSTNVMSDIIMLRSSLYGLEKACQQKEEQESKLRALEVEYKKLKDQEDQQPQPKGPDKPKKK